jgi:hypothetical protein
VVTLLALVLAAEPHLSERLAPTRPSALSLHVVAGFGFGWAPGDTFTLNLGSRYRRGAFSIGLEVQPMMPGSVAVTYDELAKLGPIRPIALPPGTIAGQARGVGVASLLPVCFERCSLFACAVAAGGGVLVDTAWQPLLSAGGRVGGEFPEGSLVRIRASVQLLGGLVRPSAGTFWQASPVQLGLMAGLVSDVF